jgi:murein L,D-transpeptidase YafK
MKIFRSIVTFILVVVCAAVRADAPPKADRILIVKSKREMTLFAQGKAIKTYKVSLGTQPVGAKERQGDHKTPEGNYVIDARVEHSRFHHALHISYPNQSDRERARKFGVNPGGAVEIHGLGDGVGWVGSLQRTVDWTDGCIAVTNSEIDEIWSMVPVGTPVEIRP